VKKNGLVSKIGMALRRHAWKADFNQCTGRQLVGAIKRAARNHQSDSKVDYPFVLIGHSKLFTEANERSLRPFLEFVAKESKDFGFATFGEFGVSRQN
jgi:hypothetical protein